MGSKARERASKQKGEPAPMIDMRATMERTMRAISKLDLDNMTPEEAGAFIHEQLEAGRLEFTPETPLEQAQELVYQAWETTGRRRQTLARRALQVSPDCADAYLLLAEAANTLEEARDLLQQGVEAGERALGPEPFVELVGEFWDAVETRPYMRVRAALAGVLWALGETEQAAAHQAELLRLNPGDNQGIRYQRVECLIALGRDREAMAVMNDYKDDISAGWAYARALLTFRETGAGRKARRALAKAMAANRFVPLYLLGLAPIPEQPPAYIGIGDEAEAVHYVMGSGDNWEQTPGAVDWLAHEWGAEMLRRLRQEYETAFNPASASQTPPIDAKADGPTRDAET